MRAGRQRRSNREGETITEKQLLELFLKRIPKSRVALEVGSHSPWISRLVGSLGHEVLVANPRRLKVITESSRKTDDEDAELLARADHHLLSPGSIGEKRRRRT